MNWELIISAIVGMLTGGGSDFILYENTSIMLVYYGGYWRVQTDKGQ